MSLDDAILMDWDDSESPYPLRIQYVANRQGIDIGDRHNENQVGFGVFCGAEINLGWWRVKAAIPWLPKILYLCAAFFRKPARVKCRLKWIRYCWLELKEWAMFRKGYWVWVQNPHLWTLRTFDGKLMVFLDKDDIPEEVDKDSMTQYVWRRELNAYEIYKPEPMDLLAMLSIMAYGVRGSC